MHFWKHALIFKMHHALSLIIRIQHLMACTSCQLLILPHLKRWKVPISNSAEFSPKSAPWRILEDLGWSGLIYRVNSSSFPKVARWSHTGEFWISIRPPVVVKRCEGCQRSLGLCKQITCIEFWTSIRPVVVVKRCEECQRSFALCKQIIAQRNDPKKLLFSD